MKILATGIHIDDIEYGMGGIVALLSKMGHEVLCLTPKPYQHYKGRNATADAQSVRGAEALGAKKLILDYNGPKYYKATDESVRACEQVIRDFQPDIVFIMDPKDNHIEHAECAKAIREAIFAAAVDGVCPNEIYTYETGMLQSSCFFLPDIYIDVTEASQQMKDSMYAFSVEHTGAERLWREKEYTARFRGLASKFELAEGLRIFKYPKNGNDFLLRKLFEGKFRWAGTDMYYPKSGLE